MDFKKIEMLKNSTFFTNQNKELDNNQKSAVYILKLRISKRNKGKIYKYLIQMKLL